MAQYTNPFHDDLPPFAGFSEDALKFLRQLRRNNNREWFMKHKPRYEQSIKEPMEALLGTLAIRLQAIDPDIVLEPRKAMYRIYRDVRFSADKTPYKTHVAAAFTFRGFDRKFDSAFYFHFSPDEFGIGGGLYMPTGQALKNIRNAIDRKPGELRRILSAKLFRDLYNEMEGERLTRVPQGFDRDYPEADLLRMKQFLCWKTMPPETIFEENFSDVLVQHIKAMCPFVKWLAMNSV